MALGFLIKLYPSHIVTDTEDCAKPLLDLVEMDYCRITDPDFHKGSVTVNTTSDEIIEQIRSAINLIHRSFGISDTIYTKAQEEK